MEGTVYGLLNSNELHMTIFYYFTGANPAWITFTKDLGELQGIIKKNSPLWRWAVARELQTTISSSVKPLQVPFYKQYSRMSRLQEVKDKKLIFDFGGKIPESLGIYDGIDAHSLELVLSQGTKDTFDYCLSKIVNPQQILRRLYQTPREFWKRYPGTPLSPSPENYEHLLGILVENFTKDEAFRIVRYSGWTASKVVKTIDILLEGKVKNNPVFMSMVRQIPLVSMDLDVCEALYLRFDQSEANLKLNMLTVLINQLGASKRRRSAKYFADLVTFYSEEIPSGSLGVFMFGERQILYLVNSGRFHMLDYRSQLCGGIKRSLIPILITSAVQSEGAGYGGWVRNNIYFLKEITCDEDCVAMNDIFDIIWPYLDDTQKIYIFSGRITKRARDYLLWHSVFLYRELRLPL